MKHLLRPLEERFDEKVCAIGTGNCWEWTGATNRGYGHIRLNGKMIYAHRVSWTLCNGKIPDGLHVLHTCDNRGCVNPSHLWLGTNADNVADKVAKGRQSRFSLKGESNGCAKLTDADVRKIRRLASVASQRKLAEMFGVSQTSVCSIIRSKKWSHIS